MYDSLLDDLEDDVTPHSDESVELVDKTADVDDADDDDLLTADPAVMHDLDVDGKTEELLAEDNDLESWSDDPVRMYLTQMGEIPLLTRQQEISLAKRIEITRAKFRRKLLECDYVIQIATKILNRVHKGELPFDRTVQVSVTDRLEKDQILGRLPHNLRTVESLLRSNRSDYRTATSKSTKMSARHEAWRRLGRRRLRAVKLIEELGLRTQRIEPLIRTLEDFSRRCSTASLKSGSTTTSAGAGTPPAERQVWLRSEFRKYRPHHAQETPTESIPAQPRRLSRVHLRNTIIQQVPSAACRKATCGWSCRSPRSIAIAASASWT